MIISDKIGTVHLASTIGKFSVVTKISTLRPEIEEWLEENEIQYEIIELYTDTQNINMVFEHKEDEIEFKLRWL